MKALVVGGTGPTGPFIVHGLRARGFRVAILHRGTHEIEEIPDDVEHIHVDPHFRETFAPGVEGRTFDLCVASYGRTRYVAELMAGRTGRFVSVGGMTYRAAADPALAFPRGGPIPLREDDAPPSEAESRFVHLIGHTEQVIRDYHPDATIFRYPYVYGPHQVVPREWSIVRRLLDGRETIVLPDGGATLMMHGYAENVAAAVLAAVDQPARAAGRSYNCGDQDQYTLRQVVHIVARAMERDVEILDVPMAVAGPARAFLPHGRPEHLITDISRLETELGYADVVPAIEGLARTTRWLIDHRPEPGGRVERALADLFDYPAEDRLIAVLRHSLARLAEIDTLQIERHHAYAHPRKPGEIDHRGR